MPPDPAHAAEPFTGWLSQQHPLDVYALVVGAVMAVIALSHWLASYHADRRALRLFALRYAAAALGWWFAHPRAHGSGDQVPLVPLLVVVGLLALTLWALDEFLGTASPRRRVGIALATGAAALSLVGFRMIEPASAAAVHAVMAIGMAYCAWLAWQAARREGGVGHGALALAFATYPAVVVGTALLHGLDAEYELAYLYAGPLIVVGLAVLVVSLLRAERRARRALHDRDAAEAGLRELNASLEQRVVARTAELRQIVEGLEGFTRSVSHDLRGPLAGLAGVGQLARDALDRGDLARARQVLAAFGPQVERLQALVQDLLALSRAGEAELQRRRQPLAPVVAGALAALQSAPDTADLLRRVPVEVAGTLPEALVDAPMLRQAVVNLVGNALRFAATAEAPRVRIGAAARDGGAVALFVADSGPGIPSAQAHRLFEPFARLHAGELSHNGIGLSIVRRIAERHGGRTWAENAPQGGAVFWLELPGAR